MNSRFIVAIAGGIGAGKRTLAENLHKYLKHRCSEDIEIIKCNFFSQKESTNYNFKVFLNQPLDLLLQKYILTLTSSELSDKLKLEQKLEEFRKFHTCHVIPYRRYADFYINNPSDQERIHQLSLEILERMKNKTVDEPPEVQVYLDNYSSRHHPSKINSF